MIAGWGVCPLCANPGRAPPDGASTTASISLCSCRIIWNRLSATRSTLVTPGMLSSTRSSASVRPFPGEPRCSFPPYLSKHPSSLCSASCPGRVCRWCPRCPRCRSGCERRRKWWFLRVRAAGQVLEQDPAFGVQTGNWLVQDHQLRTVQHGLGHTYLLKRASGKSLLTFRWRYSVMPSISVTSPIRLSTSVAWRPERRPKVCRD